MLRTASLALMSMLYVGAGITHFARPDLFLRIVPPFLPAPLALVYLSGAAEVTLGALLWVPALTHWAAWGIVALLIAVFPANVYMWQRGGAAFGLPDWALLARLPLQAVLIAWAVWHARGAG